jgi:hypothetical protein
MHPNLSEKSKYYSKFTFDYYISDIKQNKINKKNKMKLIRNYIFRSFLQMRVSTRNTPYNREIENLMLMTTYKGLYMNYDGNTLFEENVMNRIYVKVSKGHTWAK